MAADKSMAARKTTTAKKKPVKKPAPKKAQAKKTVTKKPGSKKLVIKSPKVNLSPRNIKIIIAIAIISGVLYFFRGLFVVAIVNGRPITRISVVNRAEQQAGSQALDSLITEVLISQEANKRGVEVSSADVDLELAELEAAITGQGQDFEALLLTQGVTREELKEQLKLQLMVEKIIGQDLVVADADVDAFFETNKEFLVGDTDEAKKDDAREQLRQNALQDGFQELITSLRSSANIRTVITY